MDTKTKHALGKAAYDEYRSGHTAKAGLDKWEQLSPSGKQRWITIACAVIGEYLRAQLTEL